MLYRVISLKRTPERLELFNKNNPWFEYDLFEAIDGQKINYKKLLGEVIAEEDIFLKATAGEIGIILSHKTLWEECVRLNQPMTILEDDAYLIKNFNNLVVKYCNLLENWDFIFWGMNLDQRIVLEMSPGIATTELKFNHEQVLANIQNITTQNNVNTYFYRCFWGVGLVCYSINPTSAQYLLDNIFPLHDYDTNHGFNYGIDNSIIEELPNMMALAAFPPLALTKNDRYNSTVQENN